MDIRLPTSAYLFLELAVIAFILGLFWESLDVMGVARRSLALVGLSLAAFWLLVDQVALHLGLWAFPAGGSLSIRVLGLPPEEYLLFFLHTLVCVLLVKHYLQSRS